MSRNPRLQSGASTPFFLGRNERVSVNKMKKMTEDQVRDLVKEKLKLGNYPDVVSGTGQITTFNQLGFKGVIDKPDGWYLPKNKNQVAIMIETKATSVPLRKKEEEELLKNIRIIRAKYEKVVGILYNGENIRVFKNEKETSSPEHLQPIEYYLSLFNKEGIDKAKQVPSRGAFFVSSAIPTMVGGGKEK